MRVLAPVPLAVLSLALAGACATSSPSAPSLAPSFSAPSAPSSPMSTSYVSRRPSHVQRVHVNADLVVRPDTVCVPVELHAAGADAAAAMARVEREASALRAATGAALVVEDIDARSERVGAGDDERVESKVVMKGVLEVALAGDDPWARAKQVAALHRAAVERATPHTPSKVRTAGANDEEATVHVSVGNPEPGVKDVEQHRPALLASWSERAKALASATLVEGGAVELLGCVPPAQVQVMGGTLEKVGLSLPVQCTFQVVRK